MKEWSCITVDRDLRWGVNEVIQASLKQSVWTVNIWELFKGTGHVSTREKPWMKWIPEWMKWMKWAAYQRLAVERINLFWFSLGKNENK